MSARSLIVGALVAGLPLITAQSYGGGGGGGNAQIINKCSQPIYAYNRQGSGATGEKQTIAPGSSYSTQASGDAGTIMLISEDSTDPCGSAPCTQLEYSINSMMYYDVSNINGNPFSSGGSSLVMSDSSCPGVVCQAGAGSCGQAYNAPNDVRTLTCPLGASMTWTICPSGGTGGTGGGSSSSAAAPSSSASASSYAPASSSSSAPAYSPSAQAGGQQQGNQQQGNQQQGQQKEQAQAVQVDQNGNVRERPANGGSNVVTITNTVYARDAEPTEHVHRRHEHVHRRRGNHHA